MRFLKSFLVLFAFWIILSAHFDAYHLIFGVICSGFVAWRAGDLLFLNNSPGWGGTVLRGLLFVPYLLWAVLKASLSVLYLVCHPRMMELIDPRIVQFDSTLSTDVSRTLLGNSITLTPGTFTVLVTGSTYHVHAISEQMAAGLPGEMEKRIGAVFREDA